MSIDLRKLIGVFEDTRRLLSLPDNDFSWSGWEDTADALEEIDAVLARLRSAESHVPAYSSILFAPTGPIQEVSLSSGWGDEFIALADRYDAAMGRT